MHAKRLHYCVLKSDTFIIHAIGRVAVCSYVAVARYQCAYGTVKKHVMGLCFEQTLHMMAYWTASRNSLRTVHIHANEKFVIFVAATNPTVRSELPKMCTSLFKHL